MHLVVVHEEDGAVDGAQPSREVCPLALHLLADHLLEVPGLLRPAVVLRHGVGLLLLRQCILYVIYYVILYFIIIY